jgi:hypothetical protein
MALSAPHPTPIPYWLDDNFQGGRLSWVLLNQLHVELALGGGWEGLQAGLTQFNFRE